MERINCPIKVETGIEFNVDTTDSEYKPTLLRTLVEDVKKQVSDGAIGGYKQIYMGSVSRRSRGVVLARKVSETDLYCRFNTESIDREYRPLLILIGRSGTGKTTAAERLKNKTGIRDWREVHSYTTRPERCWHEWGHRFVTEEEFNKIPTNEIVAYMEYRGYCYCATRSQLNESDIYVVDPGGYEMLKSQYHDRKMLVIELTASRDILKERMLKRGNDKEEVEDRLTKDDVLFSDVHADLSINTDNLKPGMVADKIKEFLDEYLMDNLMI